MNKPDQQANAVSGGTYVRSAEGGGPCKSEKGYQEMMQLARKAGKRANKRRFL